MSKKIRMLSYHRKWLRNIYIRETILDIFTSRRMQNYLDLIDDTLFISTFKLWRQYSTRIQRLQREAKFDPFRTHRLQHPARISTFIEIRHTARNFGNFDRPSRDAIAGLINVAHTNTERARARMLHAILTYRYGRYSPHTYTLRDGRYFIHNSRYDSHNAPRCRHLCIIQPGADDVFPLSRRANRRTPSRHATAPKWIYVTENLPISASCDKHFLECTAST